MKSFVLPMDSRQDSGMLDYRREQAEGSQDDEAGPKLSVLRMGSRRSCNPASWR